MVSFFKIYICPNNPWLAPNLAKPFGNLNFRNPLKWYNVYIFCACASKDAFFLASLLRAIKIGFCLQLENKRLIAVIWKSVYLVKKEPHHGWGVVLRLKRHFAMSARLCHQIGRRGLHFSTERNGIGTPLSCEPQEHSFVITYPYGDYPITPTLKNPHQSQCKQTETFTFKTLELNHNLQGDVWGQSSIYFQLPGHHKKNVFPIFLHPIWSSAFWDLTLRFINARSTCYRENWLHASWC